MGPFGVPGLTGPPDQIGQWGAKQDWAAFAIHTALLHTGKVMIWSFTAPSFRPTHLWDPLTNSLTEFLLPFDDQLFCAGQTTLADGRLLAVGGGHISPSPLENKRTYAFDPISETWSRMADMAHSRYYPTATTMPDGRVVATSGESLTAGVYQMITEVYDPDLDTWTELPGQDQLSLGQLPLYAMMFVIPDGRMVYAGSSPNTQLIDIDLDTRFHYGAGGYFVSAAGSAVMYEPGKVMKHGGNPGSSLTAHGRTEVLDVASSVWTELSPSNYDRAWQDLVLLPDGTTLMIGGATDSGVEDECAVHAAELWDPDTGVWTTLSSGERPRMYHSTALLLPDGRVLVSGGENLQGGREKNYEIFSPPYLFKGARPTVAAAPSNASYGNDFTVVTPDALSISSVSLLRPGAGTHSFDQNQRYMELDFTASAGQLTVSAPENANLAPPGYHLLFLVDGNGVPSVAEFILLASTPVPALPPLAWLGLAGVLVAIGARWRR